MIQENLGTRQVFSEVTRVSIPKTELTDYIITGAYDFFERLGTQGREWIPLVGILGVSINEAWVKGVLSVRVTEVKSGRVILDRSYPEEHRDKTSIYAKANAGYLQADYIAAIASDIIKTISEQLRDKR